MLIALATFIDHIIYQILDYGATIQAITLKDNMGKTTDVCLGFDDIDGYLGYIQNNNHSICKNLF